jgi:hypothetical protein
VPALPHPAPTLADPFAAIIDGLCRAVAARAVCERGFVPVALVLWGWLRRIGARFAAIAAKARAGSLRLPMLRRRLARPRSPGPAPRLPRGLGWLLRVAPEASPFATQLGAFLAEPEVIALLEAAPQLARPLRPLCRMLGVRPAPALPPARRAPPPLAAPASPRGPLERPSPAASGPPRPGAAPPPPDTPRKRI